MKTSQFSFFMLFCCLVMSFSFTMCSTETEEKTVTDEFSEAMDDLRKELKKASNDPQGSVSDALNKVVDAMEGLKKDSKVVEPVNFRILKSAIPETFLGMERSKY